MSIDIESLRFPVGKFSRPKEYTPSDIEGWISDIEQFPALLEKEVAGLTEAELAWQYRPEGWNIRQLVHHCADSHMNSFIRYKLTLTEDKPTIRPYHEDRWAEMSDYKDEEINTSLAIIKGLHGRWSRMIKSLSPEQFDREFVHPEHGWTMSLGQNTALYSWHCRHHLEHVKLAKLHKGEFD